MAADDSGESSWAFHVSSYQRPPNVLITVLSGASCSPQPGNPRRQMPNWFGGLCTFLAAAATSSQVGLSGSVTPAFCKVSLRYMSAELSPSDGAAYSLPADARPLGILGH